MTDKGEQYRVDRHLEIREGRAAQYRAERDDHPNQSEFGTAEYVDVEGRQYRLAHRSRLGGWPPGERIPNARLPERRKVAASSTVKLWCRLPKRPARKLRVDPGAVVSWFSQNDYAARKVLDLMPVKRALQRQTCRLKSTLHTRAQTRTGAVYVTGFTVE